MNDQHFHHNFGPKTAPTGPGATPEGRSLIVLGIETSCDETGVALVRLTPVRSRQGPGPDPGGGWQGEILAQALHSQVALHAQYGGVVPELASRDHVLRLSPLTQRGRAWPGRF